MITKKNVCRTEIPYLIPNIYLLGNVRLEPLVRSTSAHKFSPVMSMKSVFLKLKERELGRKFNTARMKYSRTHIKIKIYGMWRKSFIDLRPLMEE